MIGKFSINILLQSFNQADETPRDSFENKIVLYNFEEEINNKNLKELIYKSNYELPYTVVCGKINLHTIAAQKYITPQAA